jgi:hypothetical protein
MKTASNLVLSHPPPCDVRLPYAAVVGIPAVALDDRFDRPQRDWSVYFAPYPIFCLKVVRMSFNLADTLSSILLMLTISFLSSAWCC